MPCRNIIFVDGSANFKPSILLNHTATYGHKRAVKEKNHVDAISAGSLTHPKKIIHEVLMYSAIDLGFRKMAKKLKKALVKLYNIAHQITVRCAFTDFEDLIELEQSGSYENESGCKDFLKSIAEYFFKQDIYNKLV